jgi:hypothetical protein
VSRIPALVESLRASQRRIAALLEPVAGDQDWTPDAASWSFHHGIPADDCWLATMSVELAHAVFLMWAPGSQDGTLQRQVDRLRGLGLEGKTVLTK